MKKVKNTIRKITLWILCIILFFSLLVGVLVPLDENKLTYMAAYALSSHFKNQENDEIVAFKEKNGILKGVCHPSYGKGDEIVEGNIEWVRVGCNLVVYDENGLTDDFAVFISTAQYYKSCGLKVMCVYGATMLNDVNSGADFRTEEGKKKIAEQCSFFIQYVQGYVDAVQVCNEVGLDRFTVPYSFDEATDYVCYILECLTPDKGDILLGVNSLGVNCCSFFEKISTHLDYLDYVGTDIYLGCFDPYTKYLWVYDIVLRAIYSYTGKPVILCEFGYIGLGEPKTDEEKQTILESYGYHSEEEAKADIMNFVDQLPSSFKSNILNLSSYSSEEELAELIFNSETTNHLYCELQEDFYVEGYPHTRQGQADLIYDSIQRLKDLPFVCGAFVYCYCPLPECYYCGQADCPVETGWNLTNEDGSLNPAYYSVQKAYAEWQP